jgi:hypothetical protein
MMRPLVKLNSSRICTISSHPALRSAGVINFVQMSRSLSVYLSIAPLTAATGCFNRNVTTRLLDPSHQLAFTLLNQKQGFFRENSPKIKFAEDAAFRNHYL